MKQEINIIKTQAAESISYGKKSGNSKALNRGKELLYACNKIEEFYSRINEVLIQTKAQTSAIDLLENELIEICADKLNPEKFSTSLEWRKAIDKFFYKA